MERLDGRGGAFTLWQSGIMYLFAFVMMNTVSFVYGFLSAMGHSADIYAVMVAIELLMAFPLAIVFALAFKKGAAPFLARRVPLKTYLTTALLAFFGYFIAIAIAGLFIMLLRAMGVSENALSSGTSINEKRLLLNIVVIAAVPALSEEFLMRGAVLSGLMRLGAGKATLLCALMFSLLHGTVVQLPVTFLLGLMLTTLTIRTGSIFPAMLYHFLHNALSSVYGYIISPYAAGDKLLPEVISPQLAAMMIGAAALFIASLVLFPVILTSFMRRNPPAPRREADAPSKRYEFMPMTVGIVLTAAAVILNALQLAIL